MSLLGQIKERRIAALKSGDKWTSLVLSTVYGEAARVGKDQGNRESTDAEVQKVIQKFIANNKDTIGHLNKLPTAETSELESLIAENALLTTFLPIEKTGADLESIIHDLRSEFPDVYNNVGAVMKGLKTVADGKFVYDGKEASEIARNLFASK